MQIIVDNNIRIKEPSAEAKQFINSELIIDNPTFEQNERLGYSNWNVPRKLQFFIKDGKDLVVPFGMVKKLWMLHPFRDDWEYKIKHEAFINYISNISLWDYQEKACTEAIRAKNGIIVMPAGSGKTQTAIEVIARLGMKALWITHTYDLMNQSMDRARANLINADLGSIAGGKVNIGSHITFATVQTLVNLDLTQYRDTWDVVVVDECHKVCGTPAQAGMFYKVIDKLSARYKYGLTATAYRSAKGTEKAMFGLLGGTIIEVDKGVVKTMKAKVQKIQTLFGFTEGCLKPDGTINYVGMTNEMVRDFDRNSLIVEILSQNRGHYCLILSDRVKHLQFLQKHLGEGLVIDGSMTSVEGKQQRKDALELMRRGKEHFLFATYQLAKEGLDIPNLDRLFLVTPHKDRTTIIQSVGRVERECEGKSAPIVYDFVDSTGFHQNQWKARKAIYKKNENEILEF